MDNFVNCRSFEALSRRAPFEILYRAFYNPGYTETGFWCSAWILYEKVYMKPTD